MKYREDEVILYCTGRGADAKVHFSPPNNFTILKGSKLADDFTTSCQQYIKESIIRGIQHGIILNNEFTSDQTMSSPSICSGIIKKMSSNGNVDLKTKCGMNFGDWKKLPLKKEKEVDIEELVDLIKNMKKNNKLLEEKNKELKIEVDKSQAKIEVLEKTVDKFIAEKQMLRDLFKQ